MILLIDECVLSKTARLLRREGFKVITLQEIGQLSATNGTVINIANKEKAVIVTNDTDFANIVLYPLGSHGGVIVLRPKIEETQVIDEVNNILIRLLKELKPEDIEKSLIIVDRNKYRIRRK